jgi:hypothetical protein
MTGKDSKETERDKTKQEKDNKRKSCPILFRVWLPRRSVQVTKGRAVLKDHYGNILLLDHAHPFLHNRRV